MPERQEDNTFDSAELQNRIEGSEKVPCCIVKEKESIKSEGDADVIDHCGVKISTIGGPVTVPVMSKSLQENDDEGHDRLDQAELQRRLFAEAQEPDRVSLSN